LFIKKAREYDIIYIASPNNPTGNQFRFYEILNIIESLKDKLIIIDEAYVEFAEYNLANTVSKYNNVVIMRTFSKAFGLAGARIGYMLTNEHLADIFNQYLQLPYPLSSFSMQLAIEVLANIHIVKRSIELIKTERSKIFEKLNKMNQIKIFESHSNFFFFQTFNHFDKIKNSMMNEKILIKNFGNLGNYQGAMRITIGNTEMNEKIVSIFEKSQST
jgi:histidinol-phosphate aminotransferase